MGYTFKGLSSSATLDVLSCQKENINYVNKQRELNSLIDSLNINGILANKDPNEKKALKADADSKLIQLIRSNKELVIEATPAQLMKIYTSFRALDDFDSMVRFYNVVKNDEFKNSIMVNEFMLVALNKQTTPDPDTTIKIAEDLISQDRATGEIYGALGKAYLLKSKNQDDQTKRDYIIKSKNAYLEGFLKHVEYYPGINAAYRMIDLGEIEEAKKLAQLVYCACEKEGAKENSPNDQDYWRSCTLLEASCIINAPKEELITALNSILKMDKLESWQLESTYNVLQERNEIIPCDNMEFVLDVLKRKMNHESYDDLIQPSSNEEQENLSKVAAIKNKSYNYRGITSSFEGSSSIAGNYRYGGQLPDHTVSRKDILIFDNVLITPFSQLFPAGEIPEEFDGNKSFSDIQDINEFMTTSDIFIRYHYGNNNFANTGLNLEKNAEINNSIYDQTVNAIKVVSGKDGDRLADSRTNISAIFALGMGDCRHHAQVKQILFDRWQSTQMKDDILSAYSALNNNDQKLADERIAHFNEVLNSQLRTIDVRVDLPIEINSMYDAKTTPDGKFIHTQNPVTLEEHTMTILIKTNDNGELLEARLADAFYHDTYKWANMDIPIEDIKVVDGNYKFDGGFIDAEKSNDGEPIKIEISPTVYAGTRDKSNSDEYGEEINLLGIPVEMDENKFVSHLQKRNLMKNLLNNVRNKIDTMIKTQEDPQQ